MAGLDIPGRRHGVVRSQYCWLVDEANAREKTRSGRNPGGGMATKADMLDYIEMFYNQSRRHSHIGGVSPEAFEQALF